MALNSEEWEEILNVDSEVDIIEQIKEKLRNKDLGVYEEWEKNKFDIDDLFDVSLTVGNNQKLTLLHLAAVCCNEDIVNALVDRGADINAIGRYGHTPLHLAAIRCNEDIVNALVDRGADINAIDRYGCTPLHLAAKYGNELVVQALLDKGANVNAIDQCGGTPLLYATGADRKIAQALISHEIKLKGSEALKPQHLVQDNSYFGRKMSEYWDRCLDKVKKPDRLPNVKITQQIESVTPITNSDEINQRHKSIQDQSTVELLEQGHSNSLLAQVPSSSVINKKTEQRDIKTNSVVHPTNSGNGSTTVIQNTQKSKWPTVAISTLAVAALTISAALVTHFVFQASLLATGIVAGIGACCLIAAAIIYYCNKPSKSLEKSSAEAVESAGKVVNQYA